MVIGEDDGEVKIITSEEKLTLMEKAFDTGETFDETKYLVVFPIDYLPWFTPQGIKRGKAFKKEYEDVTGVAVYYDQDAGIVYFYWHYS